MSEIGVEPGEFPYPLTRGATESRYLTWLRNHSNYLAERGFLDYLRIAAVLVRGILVNFLTLLPYLLLTALFLSLVYTPLLTDWADRGGFFLTAEAKAEGSWTKWCQDYLGTKAPFLWTPWVAALAVVWYLLFPMVTRLFKVTSHKKSLQTGSDSSVKMRDRYERTFGGALLAVVVVAVVEAVPLAIHFFHRAYSAEAGWREIVAMAGGGSSVAALSGAGKLMSALERFKKTLVMGLIGSLGLVLPLVVVLYVAEYLIYDVHVITLDWRALVVVPGALALGILVAIVLGTLKGSLEKAGWLSGYLAVAVAIIVGLYLVKDQLSTEGWLTEWLFVAILAVELWLFSWLAVDVNLTSVHGFYRDRLASAYLVGVDTAGDVDIEEDIDLQEICQYENGSTAPYHLVNVALNLQGSRDIGIRERNCDFFIFSKQFIGGDRTGYCRSTTMETVFPQMDLATAMAISAAAASPNMGRGTSAPLVAVLTLFNVRLGYWVPNPGRLEPDPLPFSRVFEEELAEVRKRWESAYPGGSPRRLADGRAPTPAHGLVGLAFSGGGIRSATLNLGIVQALHQRGVFDHVDYLSTVSGGGYLGASISTLMRRKKAPEPSSVPPLREGSLRERFRWRVRPSAFLREMWSRLDEMHRWVNLSDGGHIENMATIELLRRRCKYIVTGDGEADPELTFAGLATLIRYARIDLGIRIDIDLDELRLGDDRRSKGHFAIGRIRYPDETEDGYLLYLKSSFTGGEDETVKEHRARHPDFPHESTADQFFDEGQFEAYRALGQHVAESALGDSTAERMSYADLVSWFEELGRRAPNSPFREDAEDHST